MYIAEVFQSIQGEGRHAGTPSLFIRTSGCNLRCWFCDTPYTSWEPEGTERSADSLLGAVAHAECRHVVITGGEPLLVAQMVPFTTTLRERGHYITIETAGTVFLPVQADLLSISPKLSNSTPRGSPWETRHDERRHRPDVIRRFLSAYDCQFKFVIDTAGDVADVERYLREFPEITPDRVYLLPQAIDRATLRDKSQWISVAAQQHGWQMSPRLHVELYGNRRGV